MDNPSGLERISARPAMAPMSTRRWGAWVPFLSVMRSCVPPAMTSVADPWSASSAQASATLVARVSSNDGIDIVRVLISGRIADGRHDWRGSHGLVAPIGLGGLVPFQAVQRVEDLVRRDWQLSLIH